MDIERLIEAVRLCGSKPKVDKCKQCAYWSGGDMSKCIPRMTTEAATVLSTFQAENAQLRAELEQAREDNKKLSAAMMELKCKGDISKMTVVYELKYNSALSHASVEDIARIVFDGLIREHLRVRGQKED